LQLVAASARLPQPPPDAGRRIDDDLQGIDGDADRATHRVEVIIAVVHPHEQDA
jgi:hypothetical protein